MNKTLLKLVLAACAYLLGSSLAFADVIYDSLSNPIGEGPEGIHQSPGGLADSFSTGASGGWLTDVKLVLSDANPADGDTINVALYSDDPNSASGFGNHAGLGSLITQIGSISGSSLNSNLASYDFVLATPEALSGNTRYWIDVSSSFNTAQWAYTSNTSGIGVANEYYWDHGTASNQYGPFMLSVSTTSPVPVPSAAWLFCSVLAGFGFFGRRKVF